MSETIGWNRGIGPLPADYETWQPRIYVDKGVYALVDQVDSLFVCNLCSWSFNENGYARGCVKVPDIIPGPKVNKTVLMHIEVAKRADIFVPGKQVDHKNESKIDQRRDNLRPASRSENARNRGRSAMNTTGYKGIYRLVSGRWAAHIIVNSEFLHLGTHNIAEDAARAYDRAAIKHHGEFANLNFPLVQR